MKSAEIASIRIIPHYAITWTVYSRLAGVNATKDAPINNDTLIANFTAGIRSF